MNSTIDTMAENTLKNQQVIVSMTSFPPAIKCAQQAIVSLLNGSVLPDKIILYVTMSQFAEGEMPEGLLALANDNPVFEIRNYDHDIRSYRKLIPALLDFPDAVIVTVDDDVYYHKHMLKDLLELHARIPDAILAHRAKRIKYGRPYKEWSKYRWYHFLFKRIHRSFLNIQTGVGGVLFAKARHDGREPLHRDCTNYRRSLVLGGRGSKRISGNPSAVRT